MKIIAKFLDTKTGAIAKVYRDPEWNEYVVKYFNHNGVHMDASDYHTNDKQDALNTAGCEFQMDENNRYVCEVQV
jgi:hypothetical protein